MACLDLELMNVTASTLFPDLDGAARQANIDSRSLKFSGFNADSFLGRFGGPKQT